MTPQHSPELVQSLFDAFNEAEKSTGGMSRLADLLDGTAPQTVHSWKAGGIPRWRKKPILRLAYTNMIQLPPEVMEHLDPDGDEPPPKGHPNHVEGSRLLLRERVLEAVTAAGSHGITADECADQLSESVLSVRPRFTELRDAGEIVATGDRRPNATGSKVIVWRVAEQDPTS